MFRALKKLFGVSAAEPPALQPQSTPAATPRGPRPAPQPRASESTPGAGTLSLPLSVILPKLSGELQGRVKSGAAKQANLALPLDKILPQLARGAAKTTFGELRQAAPPGTFSGGSDLDQTVVDLPLSDILPRLNPAMLKRRPSQTKVEAPEEITGPFGDQGQGLSVTTSTPKPQFVVPRAVTPAAVPAPTAAPTFTTAPAQPIAPRPTALQPISLKPTSPQPVAAPAAAPVSARETEYLKIPLDSLCENWPEAIRQESLQLNLSGATLALPMGVLEHELKHGKVAFSWKLLRSMIQPPPPASTSVHDATVLELPLKILAPLFLARQRAKKAQAKAIVGQEIPDLFVDSRAQPAPAPADAEPMTFTPQFVPALAAAPAPAAAPREEETNYYIWGDEDDTPVAEGTMTKPVAAPTAETGTAFLKRFPTPNEIVRKAASLEGVVGTVIALADGLLVAKDLPPDMNGETLAAFLPQIFGRVSQSTRELRMGDLNNLNFTVGSVPWKIFRIGGMYFAAYGRAGQSLPTTNLVAIVTELDRKSK